MQHGQPRCCSPHMLQRLKMNPFSWFAIKCFNFPSLENRDAMSWSQLLQILRCPETTTETLGTRMSSLVFAKGNNPPRTLRECAKRGQEHRRPEGKKREWTTCFCHAVRTEEDECKQDKVCLCERMCCGNCAGGGTGGTLDCAGTDHPRIYHSATVTPGQGTDVSVYLRATSDWPSLTLAQPAFSSDGTIPERSELMEKKKKREEARSSSPRQQNNFGHFSPICFIVRWRNWNLFGLQ